MAKLKIFEVPSPVLRQKAAPVAEVSAEIKQILSDMLETMYQGNGVGLAGNQVGILKRLVVLDCAGKDEEPDPIKMVNPKIVDHSAEKIVHHEGCLSVPHQFADVDRFQWVVVSYLDENGKQQVQKVEGLLAVAVQHELDHLEGILFIDYLTAFKRKLLLNKLEKRRQREKED